MIPVSEQLIKAEELTEGDKLYRFASWLNVNHVEQSDESVEVTATKERVDSEHTYRLKADDEVQIEV